VIIVGAIGVIGIVFCALLVIFLTYRGLNVIIAAPLCAVILMIFTQLPLVESFTNVFLQGSANFVKNMLGIYLAGAILGELYNASGAASSIARSLMKTLKGNRDTASPLVAILIIFIAGTVLAYGGVHVVALAYLMLPLVLEIMRESGIPRVMAPGILLGCIFTGPLAMPGSPQTQNVVPMGFLGTSSTAALVPGIIAGIVVLTLNIIYLSYTANKLNKVGIGFEGDGVDITSKTPERESYPNPWVSVIPLVLIFVLFNGFKLYIVYSIFIGVIAGIILFWNHLGGMKKLPAVLGKGGNNSCVVLVAGAVMGGFGAIVSAAPSFSIISNAVVNFPGPPLFVVAIAMMLIVGVCGSGPAGLATALPMFAETFTKMGVNPAAIHRISGFAATTLDSLPTNAVYLAITSLTGLTVRESYKYVFVTTVVATSIGTFLVAALLTVFPGLA